MLLPLELQGEDKTGAWTGQCQLGSLRAELLEAPPTMDWAPFYLLPLVFSTGWSIIGLSWVPVSSKNTPKVHLSSLGAFSLIPVFCVCRSLC